MAASLSSIQKIDPLAHASKSTSNMTKIRTLKQISLLEHAVVTNRWDDSFAGDNGKIDWRWSTIKDISIDHPEFKDIAFEKKEFYTLIKFLMQKISHEKFVSGKNKGIFPISNPPSSHPFDEKIGYHIRRQSAGYSVITLTKIFEELDCACSITIKLNPAIEKNKKYAPIDYEIKIT